MSGPENVRRGVQVLLRADPTAPLVAGLPCAVRSAYAAGRELAPDRIVLIGADRAFLERWAFPLGAAGAPLRSGDDPGSLDPRLPLLAVEVSAFPDEGGLAAFLAAAADAGAARRAGARRALAAYVRDASSAGGGSAAPSAVHERLLAAAAPKVDAGLFFDARGAEAAAAVEAVLYARLAKSADGYLARFDRRLSLALTRLMLPWPITPNQVTAASLALSLLGAWWLAAPSRAWQFGGALLLWLCCLLDGCDGELARLKLHMTPSGGAFDLWSDHVAHMATFIALPIGVARLHPHAHWWVPGSALFVGVAASAYSVWRLVLSVPESERGPLSLLVERIASRDYVYLIVALTAVGRLDWFVWAAAAGSNVFWPALWWLSRRETGGAAPRHLSAPAAAPREASS
jgi:phosphatidylglycerophosphate synthase